MTGMAIITTAIAVFLFLGFVAVGIWVRRLDADDFEQGTSTMTEDERRAMQLGIGLTAGTNLGGF